MLLALRTPQQVKCLEALDLAEMRLTCHPQILETKPSKALYVNLTSLIANFFNGIDPMLTSRDTPDLATSQYSGVVNYLRLERAF
jgi:hypothetical protein